MENAITIAHLLCAFIGDGLAFGRDWPICKSTTHSVANLCGIGDGAAIGGWLKEAAEICERYLGTDSDSAQGWYLLGLVRDASGDVSAVDCYRKALYLKPDHYETLLQMALWCQKNGDAARARTFRARAERAKAGGLNTGVDLPTIRYA